MHHYLFGGQVYAFDDNPGWEAFVPVGATPMDDAAVAAHYAAQVPCQAVVARSQRDLLLTATDWTQLPDVPLTTKADWAAYRQALRDITNQAGFPGSITWPVAPGATA